MKNNSSIWANSSCKSCDWAIVFCCCNDEMSEGEYGDWDWWVYCSNKGCKNHHGEGLFQNQIEWVKYT